MGKMIVQFLVPKRGSNEKGILVPWRPPPSCFSRQELCLQINFSYWSRLNSELTPQSCLHGNWAFTCSSRMSDRLLTMSRKFCRMFSWYSSWSSSIRRPFRSRARLHTAINSLQWETQVKTACSERHTPYLRLIIHTLKTTQTANKQRALTDVTYLKVCLSSVTLSRRYRICFSSDRNASAYAMGPACTCKQTNKQ